jgi:DNA-binding LacI/PurR family transcriptional regulator
LASLDTGRPTLETVAALAGVSRSLVSLVLRDSPKVSPARREAVLRAVAELGYRPNEAARRLAERRSRTVGVLLNDMRQPWFADMLDGLTPVLHAGGKHILLGDGRIDRMMDETLTWSFLDLGVDGLVLAGSIPMSQAIVEAASTIPTVAVGGRGSSSGISGSLISQDCPASPGDCACTATRTRCARRACKHMSRRAI